MEENECCYKVFYYGHIKEVLIFIEKFTDQSYEHVFSECFFWACKGNQKEVVDIIIKISTSFLNWNKALEGACRGGHFDLIKYIIKESMKRSKIKISIEDAFKCACKRSFEYFKNSSIEKDNSVEIVKFFEQKYKKYVKFDWSISLMDACKGGSFELVKFIEEKCKKINIQWNHVFMSACEGGSMNIIQFIEEKLTKQLTDWDRILDSACKSNSMEVVKHVIFRMPIGYYFSRHSDCLYFSSNMEILKLMLTKGKINQNGYFEKACYNGCIDTVNLLILKRSENFFLSSGLVIACERNHYNIAKLLLSKGANNTIDSEYSAKIIELLMQNNKSFNDPRVMKKYKEYVKSKITTSVFLKKKLVPFHIVNMIINEYF